MSTAQGKMTAAQNLRFLFDRPCQPVFREKGLNGDVTFSVPSDFLKSTRFGDIVDKVQTRFTADTGTAIAVKKGTIPDISSIEAFDRRTNFNLFNPYHQQVAAQLIKVFMDAADPDALMSTAVYCQPRINPYMFIYALSVAMLHRKDTTNVKIPSHTISFPELYVSAAGLNDARRTSNLPSGYRDPVNISRNLTTSVADPESRTSYFREDIGVNLHHWHWHLVYPNMGPKEVVEKNRRGELFYYMHQQLLARYNIERLSNSLPRATPIRNFQDLVPEGYFPKLDSVIASRTWAARQANSYLSDINRKDQGITFTMEQMGQWKDRIYEAIERGSVVRGSGTDLIKLTETDGIDILGNLIEASSLSVNDSFYGNYHNNGHNMLAYLHDPDNRFQESAGVMGDSATAMRDPVFYRWHTNINDMFDAYKRTLTPYTDEQLGFKGIEVTNLEVQSESTNEKNTFITYWENDEMELSRGLDYASRGSLKARFTHLQHKPFTYKISVQNGTGGNRRGTVRLFWAPKNDERRYEMRLPELRTFFIEMDRFDTMLRTGRNDITRTSAQSSITIPFDVTFRDLDEIPNATTEQGATEASRSNFVFCGCGWPDHMLVPRGTVEGLPGILFVMVTNFEDDKVGNLSMDANQTVCDNAFSFCGVRNNLYPDRRAMGFPFDRRPRDGVFTLVDFKSKNTNMLFENVKIYHRNVQSDGKTLNSKKSS